MIIIPARLASTRFPQKVLADIGGLPMVIRTAKRVESIDRVVVACDDEKILEICSAHGVEARLTSTTHKSHYIFHHSVIPGHSALSSSIR